MQDLCYVTLKWEETHRLGTADIDAVSYAYSGDLSRGHSPSSAWVDRGTLALSHGYRPFLAW